MTRKDQVKHESLETFWHSWSQELLFVTWQLLQGCGVRGVRCSPTPRQQLLKRLSPFWCGANARDLSWMLDDSWRSRMDCPRRLKAIISQTWRRVWSSLHGSWSTNHVMWKLDFALLTSGTLSRNIEAEHSAPEGETHLIYSSFSLDVALPGMVLHAWMELIDHLTFGFWQNLTKNLGDLQTFSYHSTFGEKL